MKSHYRAVVSVTERMVPAFLRYQDRQPASRDHGGQVLPARGYSEPGVSAAAIAVLASLALCPESSFCGDGELLDAAQLYARHLLREQHADGTVDLKETNFHDATMVGFSVQKLAYTWRLLEREQARGAAVRRLAQSVREFLERGARGMLEGGFHTPNHRWVMASGLALLHSILGDPGLAREAQMYLAEGIDCDEDGEYTERSAGIYNVVNNRSLLIVAEELGRDDLVAHVRRNLDLVMKYIEPDGSVFTMSSRRQDSGRRTFPVNYYENYLLMAHRTGEAAYAGMAERLLALASEGSDSLDGMGPVLTHYLLRRELRERDLPKREPPAAYELTHERSGLVRLRDGSVSLSLMAGHTRFLRLQSGGAWVVARLASTFYGVRGRVAPASIEKDGDEYVLRSHDRWGYVRPLAEAHRQSGATSRWEDLPHDRRDHVHMGDFDVEVRASFTGKGVELALRVTGVAGVLVKLELMMPPGGWLETEDLRIPGAAGQWAVLRRGGASYTLGWDAIAIEGGFAEHNSTVDMRGSEPQDPSMFTLFCTDYTPVERRLAIRAGGT